jgi:hypothetical protein
MVMVYPCYSCCDFVTFSDNILEPNKMFSYFFVTLTKTNVRKSKLAAQVMRNVSAAVWHLPWGSRLSATTSNLENHKIWVIRNNLP